MEGHPMAKLGRPRSSKLAHLLRQRLRLRERKSQVTAETAGLNWPIDQAIKANERAIKNERRRRREAKKAKNESA
jgi:hypothetical protein